MKFIRTEAEQTCDGACFVIMPFGVKKDASGNDFDWDDFYTTIIVQSARNAGMNPVRADDIYEPTAIVDTIWRGLKEAEVVVADLTGRSPNVLYELGLAHVLGKRVVLLIQDADDIPADLGGMSYLQYSLNGTGAVRAMGELTKTIKAARNQTTVECTVMPMSEYSVKGVTAEVKTVATDFATLVLSEGTLAFLKAEDWDWKRKPQSLLDIRDLDVGRSLNGFYYLSNGEPRFSPRHPRENPWPQLEQEFIVGREFTGTVDNFVAGLGAFIHLKYGINGLLHTRYIPAAVQLDKGAQVQVRVTRLDPISREVQLDWAGEQAAPTQGSAPAGPPPAIFPFEVGDRLNGAVLRSVYDRGFVLVSIDGREKPALLHHTRMSAGFTMKFQAQSVNPGDPIRIEVTALNPTKDEVTVCDVEDTGVAADEQEAQE